MTPQPKVSANTKDEDNDSSKLNLLHSAILSNHRLSMEQQSQEPEAGVIHRPPLTTEDDGESSASLPTNTAASSDHTAASAIPAASVVETATISQFQEDTTANNTATDASYTTNKMKPQPVRSNKKAYQVPVEDGSPLTVVDVVLGRGGLANNHPGNKDLLQRIKDLQTVFKKYSDMNKQEKNDSTRLISDWVKDRGGRFLKMQVSKDFWREVDQRQAYNKIMHMFRDDHSTEGRARKRLKYSKYKQLIPITTTVPKNILPKPTSSDGSQPSASSVIANTTSSTAIPSTTTIPGIILPKSIPSEGSQPMLGLNPPTNGANEDDIVPTSSRSQTTPPPSVKASSTESLTAVVQVTPTTEYSATDDSSQITEKDVLFGRGGHANNNAGNQQLLKYIKSKQDEYKAFGNAENGKKQKKDLTLQVVDWVLSQGGRFLKKRGAVWEETTQKEARLKVSQLFRNDHTPEARLRKRKKYNGEIWVTSSSSNKGGEGELLESEESATSPPPTSSSNFASETTVVDSSSDSNPTQETKSEDKDSNLCEEEEGEPSQEEKPVAVTPPPIKKETTNSQDPVATASSLPPSNAVPSNTASATTTMDRSPSQPTETSESSTQPAEGGTSSKKESTISPTTTVAKAATPAPTIPHMTHPTIDSVNPAITNITLPEGAYPTGPSFHMPTPYHQYFQAAAMGMHHHHPVAAAAAAAHHAAFDAALRNHHHRGMQSPYIPPAIINYAAGAETPPRWQSHVIVGSDAVSNETNNVVGTFTDKDILLGRGGHANHHPGNKLLLDRVKQLQPTYKSFGSEEDGKRQKNNLTRELVEWVKSKGGRFLKRRSKDVPWREVSYNEARMKVSHLFRNDHTPEGRERKRKRYAAPKNNNSANSVQKANESLSSTLNKAKGNIII